MDKWNLVKSQARVIGKANDWAYIIQKYRELGGSDKQVELVVNMKKSMLIGQSSTGSPIVKSESNELIELTNDQYIKSRKTFKSTPPCKITAVNRVIKKPDGTQYNSVVYMMSNE